MSESGQSVPRIAQCVDGKDKATLRSTFIGKNLDIGRKDCYVHSPNSVILPGALAMVRLRRVDFAELRSSDCRARVRVAGVNSQQRICTGSVITAWKEQDHVFS